MNELTKQDDERFVFPDMSYQDFPSVTSVPDAIVVKKTVDLSTMKFENGAVVPLTTEDLQAGLVAQFTDAMNDYEKRIDEFLDSKAQSYGYDSIKTAVTYADEPSVPKFQDEGKAFRKWRSLVFAKCYEIVATAQETLTVPPFDDVLAQLPVFELDAPQ